MTEEGKGRLLVALATLGFASMAIWGKIAFAAGANVVTLLSTRFMVGAGVLWLLLHWEGTSAKMVPRQGFYLVLLGIFGYGGATGAFFTGLQYIPAALASMLFFIYPVYLAIITALWGGEGFSRRQGLALGLALAGLFLTLGPVWTGINLAGVLWILGAALLHSLYLVLTSRLTGQIPPLVFITYITTAAAVAYTVAGMAGGGFRPIMEPKGWLAVIVMGVLTTAICLRALWSGIGRIGINQAALITTMEPMVTTFYAVLFLGESWGLRQLLGAALLLLGVWWVPQKGREEEASVNQTEVN